MIGDRDRARDAAIAAMALVDQPGRELRLNPIYDGDVRRYGKLYDAIHALDRPAAAPDEVGRKALEWLASENTAAELLSDEVPMPWAGKSIEQRISMIGERRVARDAAILNARAALQPTPSTDSYT